MSNSDYPLVFREVAKHTATFAVTRLGIERGDWEIRLGKGTGDMAGTLCVRVCSWSNNDTISEHFSSVEEYLRYCFVVLKSEASAEQLAVWVKCGDPV